MTEVSISASAQKVAGIDIAKASFEVAVHGSPERLTAANEPSGHELTAQWLRAAGVKRVGLEASGHYEAGLVGHLRRAGFAVVVLDPGQVHGFRRFKKQRAKTDPIDATMIAAATAMLEMEEAPPDPRLEPFAEHLTLIEQIGEDIARLKTRRDRFSDKVHKRYLEREIARLEGHERKERLKLAAKLKAHADLHQRYKLLQSIPCIGEVASLSLVIRMPELGSLSREEAAALVGVAPFNVDSGKYKGERHICGGRWRVRKVLYMAALSGAYHWNPLLQEFCKRLLDKGKEPKVAITACMRKLICFANAVLARGTPWVADKAVAKAQ